MYTAVWPWLLLVYCNVDSCVLLASFSTLPLLIHVFSLIVQPNTILPGYWSNSFYYLPVGKIYIYSVQKHPIATQH